MSVRRPLVKFLEMHGFAVVTAETSDEGLDALQEAPARRRRRRPAAARGSGRDVVVATPADVPVIIFSGVPSESAELERLRPRTRLIEKPYSLVLLVETLEEMLAESRLTESSFLAPTAPARCRAAPSCSARRASGSPRPDRAT